MAAHPRSRGENTRYVYLCPAVTGSSPLTRGKQSRCRSQEIVSGLIPAHAGKTALASSSIAPAAAHPRSRGENLATLRAWRAHSGSSPLTRGKQLKRPGGRVRPRLIPAHAGKTRPPHERTTGSEAHPRSRGENRPDRNRTARRRGLIPAHAGKTAWRGFLVVFGEAHPRSRGENHELRPLPLSFVGSSPLTRGKPTPAVNRGDLTRLIPAHAGKTYRRAFQCRR